MRTSKQDQISTVLKELVQDSTSHGIPRVVKSKSWFAKLIWSVCFLGSTAFCIYLILNSVSDYLKYDFNTRIEIIREIPSVFPTITLCNLNKYLNKAAVSFMKDTLTKYPIISQFETYQQNFFIINELIQYNDSFKKNLSLNLNETILKCSYNSAKCNLTYFKWTFHKTYGNCFVFNSGQDSNGENIDLLKASNSGSLNGLRLELFIGNPRFISDIIERTGFHIMVNNASINPLIDEGYDVSAGASTNIEVERNFEDRLSEPYNSCFNDLDNSDAFDSDIFKAVLKSNKTYRQLECFNLCYQKAVISKCNCYLLTYDKLNGVYPCSTIEDIDCSMREYKNYNKEDINQKCSPFCPLECDSKSLPVKISFSDYPTESYAKSSLYDHPVIMSQFANETITYDKVKRSLLAVNIYYPELVYTVAIQQPKMLIFDIISNIGGLLGLFIGVSFLSFVEILEAVYEVFSILLTKNSIIVETL